MIPQAGAVHSQFDNQRPLDRGQGALFSLHCALLI